MSVPTNRLIAATVSTSTLVKVSSFVIKSFSFSSSDAFFNNSNNVAAEFVRVVLAAAVVEVEHGGHGVDAQAVDVVLLQPVHGVRDEERLHLALAEVEDAGRPVGVLVHERVFQLIAAGAIEFIKAVLVLREVGRDPVEQHADAGLVALVHKAHELLRLAVAERRSIVARLSL